MTPRDIALLRAVQTLGDEVTACTIWRHFYNGWYAFLQIEEDMKRLEDLGVVEHYFVPVPRETGGQNLRCWRLTAAGEAALKEEGE